MRRLLTALALSLLFSLFPSGFANAQTAERCFPETGYCISGAIRQYWERNGGLAVFGYPISPARIETVETWSGLVQWFERDRLEDHSNENKGVLAGRLGAEWLELNGTPWSYGSDQPQAGCEYFQATGYKVCGEFLTYWRNNGGLERFGYPITSQFPETIEGRSYAVQYFERRRMELHPENAKPYDVLLGLLGKMVYERNVGCSIPVMSEIGWFYTSRINGPVELGCAIPGQDYANTAAATARFEHGEMLWLNQRGGNSVIFVIFYNQNGSLSFRKFVDEWREGDIIDIGLEAPNGMYEPRRGFGKVWRENDDVRQALGWALEPEQAAQFNYQIFQKGEMACSATDYSRGCWVFTYPSTARLVGYN